FERCSRTSPGVRQRDREARWKNAERSLEEDHKTHRKNVRVYRIGGTLQMKKTTPKKKLLIML
ncbi:hypothetical protein BHM03_00055016, partial [Ensete ventricosum]